MSMKMESYTKLLLSTESLFLRMFVINGIHRMGKNNMFMFDHLGTP